MGVNLRSSTTGIDHASQTRFLARVGTRLATRWVLAVLVAALLLTVGVLATASSYLTLKEAGHARTDAWLTARREQLQATLGSALAVADPLLEQLAAFVRGGLGEAPVQALVPRLQALAAGREGVTWISVSLTDGMFVGVQRDAAGRYLGQASVVGAEWMVDVDERGQVHERARVPSDYDPRRRPFYELAVREGRRAWTEPYAFLPDWHTGVTRVEPVYASDQADRLLAVLTVDFDAVELARLLGEPLVPGQRTLVVTAEGVVLATSGLGAEPTPAPSAQQREPPPPAMSALNDPAVEAMRSVFAGGRERSGQRLDVGGEAYRYDARQVLDLSGQRVLLLTAVPERELYADANRQALGGAVTTGTLTLVGLLLAMAVSSSFANHRRKRARAERAARRAEEQARQLGRYELLAPLGSGAMGEVFRARHTLLARDAALKLIKLHDGPTERDPERQRRFFDEAQRLASLHSLHTVSVYDFGVAEDGRYYLVMELLDGLDLASLVARDGPQPAARVASILAQVCASLAEAHDAGLVHQDIKPANVFLCRIADALDFVKVLDFGLARAVGDAGDSGTTPTIEGTPAYMAPEQVLREPITPAVDLYALGGLGYFLLTGAPPYAGSRSDALYAQHVHGPLPSLPEDVAARTPRMLAQLLTRCLAKRPDHRPTSARVLQHEFESIAREHEHEFGEEQRARWWASFDAARAEQPLPPTSPASLPVRLDTAHSLRRRSA